MEYTRRYPSRYVTCVLLLFTLMLRAGMTVAATEAAISGYEIEGIPAAMGRNGDRPRFYPATKFKDVFSPSKYFI